jgi:hypothetical protein
LPENVHEDGPLSCSSSDDEEDVNSDEEDDDWFIPIEKSSLIPTKSLVVVVGGGGKPNLSLPSNVAKSTSFSSIQGISTKEVLAMKRGSSDCPHTERFLCISFTHTNTKGRNSVAWRTNVFLTGPVQQPSRYDDAKRSSGRNYDKLYRTT